MSFHWSDPNDVFVRPIFGAMGEGMGMGGNMGMSCPPPPPPPSPTPPTILNPLFVGNPTGAKPGSLWVQGSALYFISSTGGQYGGTEPAVSTPVGAIPGSMWIGGPSENFNSYIDASGVKRSLFFVQLSTANAGAINGSLWISSPAVAQDQYQAIIRDTRKYWHHEST
jgi:hypothetical protein